jgi:hypothetical protein
VLLEIPHGWKQSNIIKATNWESSCQIVCKQNHKDEPIHDSQWDIYNTFRTSSITQHWESVVYNNTHILAAQDILMQASPVLKPAVVLKRTSVAPCIITYRPTPGISTVLILVKDNLQRSSVCTLQKHFSYPHLVIKY